MLKINYLPIETKRVFELMAEIRQLSAFTLIGGTALALQIGHRLSEDLDFWVGDSELNKRNISETLHLLAQKGCNVKLTTPSQNIIFEKINGRDLLLYAQDYSIDGVKVTFFARNDIPYKHFNQQKRISDTNTSFAVMAEEGIFIMKSHVIHKRTRSRDLFDLKVLLETGKYSIEDIFTSATKADLTCTPEYAKAVLTGQIPLEKKDEGFSSLNINANMTDIYEFFSLKINEYESCISEDYFLSGNLPKD